MPTCFNFIDIIKSVMGTNQSKIVLEAYGYSEALALQSLKALILVKYCKVITCSNGEYGIVEKGLFYPVYVHRYSHALPNNQKEYIYRAYIEVS